MTFRKEVDGVKQETYMFVSFDRAILRSGNYFEEILRKWIKISAERH